MPILLIVLALPLIEIALFIAVGARIGVGGTLGLVVLSTLAGVLILRGKQARLQAMMRGGLSGSAGRVIADGAFGLVAGILLVIPGFATSALGLLLLVAPLQRLILRRLGARTTVAQAAVWRRGDVVEGEYSVHDAPTRSVPADHRIDPPRGH